MVKKLVLLVSLTMALLVAGCSGGGGGGEASVGNNPGGGSNGAAGVATVNIDFNTATTAKSAAKAAAIWTHYDVLRGAINAAHTASVTFTSPTNVYTGTATILPGTTTSVPVAGVGVGTYTLSISILTTNNIVIFTSSSTVNVVATGPNTFTPVLVVSPTFGTAITITGFPVGTTGVYPVTVTQTLSSGATSVSTVNGAYDLPTNSLVFTPQINFWPDHALSLTYAVPTFGVAVNGDPLNFDVLAILTAPVPSMSAAYHASIATTVTIGMPTLVGLGMDLATTAGIWIEVPGSPARAVRTTGTGMVTVNMAGGMTDVILTTPVNAVIGVGIPFTFACTGSTNPVEIMLVQNGGSYTQLMAAPITTTCGNPNPATPWILTPTQSMAAKVELRFGGATGTSTFYNVSL